MLSAILKGCFGSLLLSLAVTSTVFGANKEITVSIASQAEWGRALLGDQVTIHVLVPQGASPAFYELTPRQIRNLKRSRYWIGVGNLPFERRYKSRLKKITPHTQTMWMIEGKHVADTDHEPVSAHHDNHHANHVSKKKNEGTMKAENHAEEHAHYHVHEGADPHVWVSPMRATHFVKRMKAAFESDPVLADETAEAKKSGQSERYLRELDTLHKNAKRVFGKEHATVLSLHSTFHYLVSDYGMRAKNIETEGKKPSLRHVMNMVSSDEEVSAIYVNRKSQKRLATTLSKKLNVPLKLFNPTSRDYVGTMQAFLADFQR